MSLKYKSPAFIPCFHLSAMCAAQGMIGVLAYSVFSEAGSQRPGTVWGSASILQDLSKRPMWLFNNWVT